VLTPALVMLKWDYMENIVGKYIKRDIFNQLAGHLEEQEITLITGSRQVGKTVLLDQLKIFLIEEKSINKDLIFSYNLDLIQDWEVFQNQTDFIGFLKDHSKKQKIYIFIDEAQKVPEAARFFKGVYDSNLNIKLVLTGSSSLELKADLKETLAGRKRVFQVLPFSFLEFLRHKEKFLAGMLESNKKSSRIDEKKLLDYYKEYIIFGGYPRVILTETKEGKINILKEIYSSYVEKDVVGLLEIKNKPVFNRLLKLLAFQIGQLVNIDELATNLGADRKTVEKYIFSLEETFILKKISPFFTNPRQEVIKSSKVYFADLGLRNLIAENFDNLEERTDKGVVLENAVLIELFQLLKLTDKLRFWRTKQGAEVDFIVESKDLIAIESKFGGKKESISLGLRNFIKKFKPKKAIVANLSINGEMGEIEGAKIELAYPFNMRL
jgi:uncharacterized protein